MPTNNVIAIGAAGAASIVWVTVNTALTALIAAHPNISVIANAIDASGLGDPTTGTPSNVTLVVNVQYVTVP